jgi:pilus assembly protein FimV
VIQLLNVPGEKQVMLKVRIAEIKRSAFRQLGADLDFDINDISLESEGAVKSEPVLDLSTSAPPMPELDLSSISLDLGGANPAEEQAGAKDDKWYDVQTKFDLAKAYQEMGDKEGAREILREVISEGDSEQQAAAEKVLETLS